MSSIILGVRRADNLLNYRASIGPSEAQVNNRMEELLEYGGQLDIVLIYPRLDTVVENLLSPISSPSAESIVGDDSVVESGLDRGGWRGR
jgi:hypothetical protein